MISVSTHSGPWFFAGLSSSFPNIEPPTTDSTTSTAPTRSKTKVSLSHPCPDGDSEVESITIPCHKVFDVSASSSAIEITHDPSIPSALHSQVLVFQYRGKFHAVDHQCPHSSYPLSKGALYDIEDFGVVFSAGITCPKHGWAFDLWTGESDRGAYKLGVWDVEVRDRAVGLSEGVKGEAEEGNNSEVGENGREREVWVRRKKKRMG